MRQNVIEIGPVAEKKRLYVTKWHKKRRGDTNPHYMQYSSKKIIKNFFIILFYTIAPLIILYYRIIFRISNTVLYIILYIYYIERNKKERKYRKFHFLHVSIYL